MSHPLDGIFLKTERADEHIRDLNAEINTLIDGNIYRLISEPDADSRECVLRVVGPEPPGRFAVITGEIVHQLRSSLDHLVWQLVIANKQTPTRSHQFPICDTPKKFEMARNRGKIKGISLSAQTLIDACQPYSKSKDVDRNFLHVLRELDNSDKHHSLTIVIATANARELSIGSGGDESPDRKNDRKKGKPIELTNISPPKGAQRPTEQGIELLRFRFREPEPDVKVTGKPVIQIVFGNSGAMTKQPVVYIVRQLRDKAVGLIESFHGEFT